MRKALKNFDWHIYKPSVADMSRYVHFVKEIITERKEVFQGILDKHDSAYVEGVTDEITSDTAYYRHIDEQYILASAVIRIYSLFEYIMKDKLSLLGQRKRFQDILKDIFDKKVIDKELYDELLLWKSLRDAIVHVPPEHYNPAWLELSDIVLLNETLARALECIDTAGY